MKDPLEDALDGEEDALDEEEELWWKGPIKIILAVFLLLIIITWTFAVYAGKINPSPSVIPTITEVVPYIELNNISYKINRNDYYTLIYPMEPVIKQTADRIATFSCDSNRICQAKALYYFVRNNYEYVSDPVQNEYIKDPKEFLSIGSGDCEDGAIALANLMEAIGISAEFVFIPSHALIRIKLPEASKRYKINGFVYLDWTCKNCEFGEVSLNVMEYI
ncbi:MAG: transglutaminase-like domain-containing protein [Nanoarchaeota archaeon]